MSDMDGAIVFDRSGTVGAILIGGLVAAVLYGITILQTFVYYRRCGGHDRWLIKGAVGVLWLLDTFDMLLIAHILYYYLVVNYGNPASLGGLVWSIVGHLMTTACTEATVRAMFAWRVWKLSNGKWLPVALVGLLTLLDFVFGIIVTVQSVGKTFAMLEKVQAFVLTEFTTGLTGDMLIAFLLCYFLFRSRTGFRRTDSVVTVLMAYVINTGLITAIALTANIVLFVTARRNFAFVALYFVVSKLYANAYLAMLNARAGIREKMSGGATTVPLSRLSARGAAPDTPRRVDFVPAARRATVSSDKSARACADDDRTAVDDVEARAPAGAAVEECYKGASVV